LNTSSRTRETSSSGRYKSLNTPQPHSSGPVPISAAADVGTADEMATHVADLERLHQVTLLLAGTQTLPELLLHVLDAALDVHNARMGLLSLWDEDRGGLVVHASRGLSPAFLQGISLVRRGEGACGLSYESGRRVIVADTDADPVFEKYREGAANAGFRAVHSTPLIAHGGKIVGVITVHFAEPYSPSARQVWLMDMYARLAADLIEGAQLRERMETELNRRNALEASVREAEQRFRMAAQNPAITLYEQDRELRYTWLFPAHQEHQNALGRTDEELLSPDEGAILAQWKREVMRTGVPLDRECRVTLAGKVFHYALHIAPMRASDGEIVGVTGAALDITQRKATEEALKRSEQRMRVTYSRAPVGIAEADLQGRLTAVNERLCEMLGYPAHELIGRTISEITHPEDAARDHADFVRLSTGEIKEYQKEKRYIHKTGRFLWVAVAASVVAGPDGVPQYCVGVIQDISARKHAETALRHRTALLEQLNTLACALSAELNETRIGRKVTDTARSICGAEFGAYYQVAGQNGKTVYTLVATSGLPAYLAECEHAVPYSSVEDAIGRARVAYFPDLQTESDKTESAARMVIPPGAPKPRSYLSRTIISGSGAALGRLVFWSTKPNAIAGEAERLIETVASQAAIALDHAHLHSALERELAEHKLAEAANRRLAAIVESSEDAIIGINLQAIVTSWNVGAERILGYKADEIIGRSILTVIPDERQNEESLILQRISAGERVEHFETIRRHKSGRLLHISLTVSPIKDHDGRVIGASKIARDVSYRKHIEQQQQALYELVARVNRAESLPDIYEAALDSICRCQRAERASILLADEKGVMRFNAWRGLSEGYRRAVDGHSPWRPDETSPEPVVVNDVAAANLPEDLRRVVTSEGIAALVFIPLTYEKRLLGKFMIYYDAPQNLARRDLQAAETIASQVAFAIVRQRDEQALEALVHERTASLREAIAQMEEFSYSVSHDLRSPVRAMQGYAAALLDEHAERLDESGREYLNRIVRNGARMDRLIQDVLTYSRLSRREIELRPLDLQKLLQELFLETAELNRQVHCITIETPLHNVVGHEPSMLQVLYNLVSNALKFIRPGEQPHVRIRTSNRNGSIRISVCDNGIGIKPEYHHRLFGMFERIHPDRAYDGTGIGLAIVRKAVERMGGKVGVVSDGTTGAEFWVELPAA
jgi:PAS domain S-box-containing protein